MAKATEADMAIALQISGVLEDIDSGVYPRAVLQQESDNADDGEPVFFDPDDKRHLRALYDRLKACMGAASGGMMRVVYGMSTMLDPDNAIVDPSLSHLALHPRIEAALKAHGTE